MGKGPEGGSSQRAVASDIRAEIVDAAYVLFRDTSYAGTTVTHIGSAVGLTAGAVLYHFGSKAAILQAILDPYVTALDDLLTDLENSAVDDSTQVLGGILDVMLAAQPAANLLTRDPSSRDAADLEGWAKVQRERITALLVPPHEDDPTGEIRVLCALGAMGRPLIMLPEPLPQHLRDGILHSAVQALHWPATMGKALAAVS
jgi:AcrR family transcriptional regulator